MPDVIVTNVAFEPVGIVDWQKAATMLVRGTVYNLHDSELIKTVCSPSLALDIHRVVHTTDYFYVPGHNYTSLDSYANKKTILKRDNWTCAYCSHFADTIDHIIPRAAGGRSTFGNQVASCKPCNNKKGDKTLNEVGMTLKITPSVYDRYADIKLEIGELFSTLA